ncbi:MAG: hypothetical protein ACYDHX_08135 [Methanothrix sp.]
MNKKEGGESQLDVGGKNSHRLSLIHYTSIAEIKGFRFKLRKDLSPPQREIIKKMIYQVPGGPAPIHSALLEGANHREVMARPCPKLDFKPGSKAARALEFHTASELPEPFSWGLLPVLSPLASTCAASCPDRVLA